MSDINYIEYIATHITSLTRDDHLCVLRIMLNSSIDQAKIKEKPAGTQIKYSDIPVVVLEEIYNFVRRKITDKTERLEMSTAV
jgi:hypothetical protein